LQLGAYNITTPRKDDDDDVDDDIDDGGSSVLLLHCIALQLVKVAYEKSYPKTDKHRRKLRVGCWFCWVGWMQKTGIQIVYKCVGR